MWREKEKSRKGGVKRMDGSWRDLSKKDCLLVQIWYRSSFKIRECIKHD